MIRALLILALTSFARAATLNLSWTGTGDSTVIRVWRAPTANTPASYDHWDAADSPTITFTANPGTPVDSGARIGIGGYEDAANQISFNNAFWGDAP